MAVECTVLRAISHETESSQLCIKGGGGGGGNGYFFVKLDFEIAVDQQNKTSDRTFEGGPGPQPPNGARGAATPIFGPN